MPNHKTYIGLDVGEKRIGVALASTDVGIAIPYGTFPVDGNEFTAIVKLAIDQSADFIVIGYPRNQSGEATAQTAYVEQFAEQLKSMEQSVVFQDESLTSVMAEQRLQSRGGSYEKGDIDSEAATIILQDYLEQNR